MRFIWNAAEKDLRRHLRDPFALLLWLAIPLLFGGLMTLVMSGSGGPPPVAHLLVADEDGGNLSALLVRAFGQGGAGQFLLVEDVKQDEGRARIADGKASALLVIPEGFVNAVLQERATILLLVTNPSQTILPQMVEEGLEMLVDGVFYLHRVAGPEIRELVSGPPQGRRNFSNQDIARLSVSINQIVERLEKHLFPPVITLDTSLDKPSPALQIKPVGLFLPSILFMALLFMADALSTDIWRERDQGTLRRAACTPSSLATLLAGKVVAGGCVILGSALVVIAAGMVYLGLSFWKLPLAVGWSTCAGVVFMLLLVAIQLHASSQRAGSMLANCLTFPLLFIGGCMFPFEMMPDWMAAVGRLTPNGWAIEQLKAVLFDRPASGSLPVAFLAVLAVGAALFLISERRLRLRFVRS